MALIRDERFTLVAIILITDERSLLSNMRTILQIIYTIAVIDQIRSSQQIVAIPQKVSTLYNHIARYFNSNYSPDNKGRPSTQSAKRFQILAIFQIHHYLA